MSSKQDLSSTFTKETGDIHLGGIDALVRLTLDQVRTDARRGLKTGMFVSGYRGSPVGMLDAAHLFESSTTRIGVRRNAWLRGYVYAFIELFAPHLSRHVVDAALAGGGEDPGL